MAGLPIYIKFAQKLLGPALRPSSKTGRTTIMMMMMVTVIRKFK